MVKIIICTTFRDFNGSENDKIQHLFLKSVKNQTYQNYQMVTTMFGEKNVKNVVDSYLKEKSLVYDVKLHDYRFSLTDVLLNAISESEKCEEDSVILWTCCDNILGDDLFKTMASHYKEKVAGVIHPNLRFKNIDDAEKKIGGGKAIFSPGIDSVFFDARLLQQAKKDIESYRFYEWGFFEYFLLGIIAKYANSCINLYPEVLVARIDNDRKITAKSKDYIKKCTDLNLPTYKRFMRDNNMRCVVGKQMAQIVYLRYTPTKMSFEYFYFSFWIIIDLLYFCIKFFIGRLLSIISRFSF